MRQRIAALAAGLALAVMYPGAGTAQQAPAAEVAAGTAPGMLTSRSFHPPPEGASIFVAPYDDSALNLTLKGDFENALRASGRDKFAPENAAGLVLLFGSEVVPADLAPRPPSLGSAEVTDRGAEVNVNVWSSSQDSVLGGRQESAQAGSNVFHLNALLRDGKTGEVVWQGDAYYALGDGGTERVARALVAPLVDKIGQSVAREPLRIE